MPHVSELNPGDPTKLMVKPDPDEQHAAAVPDKFKELCAEHGYEVRPSIREDNRQGLQAWRGDKLMGEYDATTGIGHVRTLQTTPRMMTGEEALARLFKHIDYIHPVMLTSGEQAMLVKMLFAHLDDINQGLREQHFKTTAEAMAMFDADPVVQLLAKLDPVQLAKVRASVGTNCRLL